MCWLLARACLFELGLFSFLGVQIMVTSHLFPIMLHVGWSVSSQHIGCVYILVGLASLILLLLASVSVHRWLSKRKRELSTPPAQALTAAHCHPFFDKDVSTLHIYVMHKHIP